MMIDLSLGTIKDKIPENVLEEIKNRAFVDVSLYPKNYDSLVSKLAILDAKRERTLTRHNKLF